MQTAINPKDLRRALGQFPTGVTVITTCDDAGEIIGVTASSFNSVSMDPPLVLWSVAKNAYSAKAFKDGKSFVVNMLGKHQSDISNRFARQGEDKFANMEYERGIGGCPILKDTAGYFECETWNTYDGGDHEIVVGKIVGFQHSESIMPLVFARGSYSVATPQPVDGVERDVSFAKDGFLSNYLLYLLNQAHALYAAELYPLLMSECGVTPEEWRVLTLLADTQSLDVEQLARLAMQPVHECHESVQRLVDKNYVIVNDQGLLKIDRCGSDLAKSLFELAKSHEQTVLNGLSHEQKKHITASLVNMISAFGHPSVANKQRDIAV